MYCDCRCGMERTRRRRHIRRCAVEDARWVTRTASFSGHTLSTRNMFMLVLRASALQSNF
jgi:hypothetical protein